MRGSVPLEGPRVLRPIRKQVQPSVCSRRLTQSPWGQLTGFYIIQSEREVGVGAGELQIQGQRMGGLSSFLSLRKLKLA